MLQGKKKIYNSDVRVLLSEVIVSMENCRLLCSLRFFPALIATVSQDTATCLLPT